MTDEQLNTMFRRGLFIMTESSRRMSYDEKEKSSESERSRIYSNFTEKDKGRSRELICSLNAGHRNYEYNARLIENAPATLAALKNLSESVQLLPKLTKIQLFLLKLFGYKSPSHRISNVDLAVNNAKKTIDLVEKGFRGYLVGVLLEK